MTKTLASPLSDLQRLGQEFDNNPASVADQFNGDNDALCRSIGALLEMDAAGSLVPHGVGGHARTLLSAARHRLAIRQTGGEARSVSVAEEWAAYMTDAVSNAPQPLQQLGEWLAKRFDSGRPPSNT